MFLLLFLGVEFSVDSRQGSLAKSLFSFLIFFQAPPTFTMGV
jgi:hypothetical protein